MEADKMIEIIRAIKAGEKVIFRQRDLVASREWETWDLGLDLNFCGYEYAVVVEPLRVYGIRVNGSLQSTFRTDPNVVRSIAIEHCRLNREDYEIVEFIENRPAEGKS